MNLDFAIGYSRTNSFVSKAMQWFMRSKISHTFIIVTINNRVRMTVGVDETGVHWIPLNTFKSRSDIVAVFTPTGPPVTEDFWWAIDEYGDSEYDYMAAGAIGFRNRIKWAWRWLKGIWRKNLDPHKLTCMELVTRILRRAGYKSISKEDLEMFDSQQLLKRMLESPDEFRVDYVSDIIKPKAIAQK